MCYFNPYGLGVGAVACPKSCIFAQNRNRNSEASQVSDFLSEFYRTCDEDDILIRAFLNDILPSIPPEYLNIKVGTAENLSTVIFDTDLAKKLNNSALRDAIFYVLWNWNGELKEDCQLLNQGGDIVTMRRTAPNN